MQANVHAPYFFRIYMLQEKINEVSQKKNLLYLQTWLPQRIHRQIRSGLRNSLRSLRMVSIIMKFVIQLSVTLVIYTTIIKRVISVYYNRIPSLLIIDFLERSSDHSV